MNQVLRYKNMPTHTSSTCPSIIELEIQNMTDYNSGHIIYP